MRPPSFIDAQTGSKPFLLTAVFSDFAPPYAIGTKFLDGLSAGSSSTTFRAGGLPARNHRPR